jgi:hypothetical protein
LRQQAVHDIGSFEAFRTRHALEHTAEDDADREAQIRYVSDHGFRSLGLTAMFDQSEVVELGEQLRQWLAHAGSRAWPLAYATAPVPWRAPDPDWERLVGELAQEPDTAPRELASCLLPASMHPTVQGHSLSEMLWNTDRPSPRWSRQALAPYGIDPELLRTMVYGRTRDPQPQQVSDISRPALVSTLFRSIEAALTEAREDVYHWSHGLSVIQPTDPEVILTVRVCLHSEITNTAVRELPPDLPMSRALVELVEAVDGLT